MRVDPDLVRKTHNEVGDRLHLEQENRQRLGQPARSIASEQQYARSVIAEVIREQAEQRIDQGEAPLAPDVEEELAQAVFAKMYMAGRLTGLLADETIEEISINGCDEVWVSRSNSDIPRERVDPVAESDDELIKLVQNLAAYAGLNSRPWDSANWELDLGLPDGSRLSAIMGVSPRPAISIRRQTWAKMELADMVGSGTITPEIEDFLRALIKGRLNVMISGATKAGKTSLLRAMASEIPAWERLITVEIALELGLHKFVERHPNAVALEARNSNSEGQGEVPMNRLVRRSLRMDPDRVIVGEVLGGEVISMLSAMGQGNDGSLSTIHARNARHVFERIATYAAMAEEQLSREAAFMLVAGGLDFVVHVHRDPATGARRVTEIIEVQGFDGQSVADSKIFATDGPGPAVWTGVTPYRIDRLLAGGWVQPGTEGTW